MRVTTPLLLTLSSLLCHVQVSVSLSSVAERSQLARSRLHEALASPSGKLTLSPELIIDDPDDPTAILLQTSEIQKVSEIIRTSKANAVYISASSTAVRTFLTEQEAARGNFPGPVPVVYCGGEDCSDEDLVQLSEAGAAGLSVAMKLDSFDEHVETCRRATDCGLQLIPEVIISDETARTWNEEDVSSLVDTLISTFDLEPVCVLLTVVPLSDSEESSDEEVTLPPVSRELSKKIPILASINVPGDIVDETVLVKAAGFTGAVLRASCLPQFPKSGFEPVGRYWGACIADLKSTRSKSFSFRAKNKMEKNVMTEWEKYGKDVVESGAIGDFTEDADAGIDTSGGDYKGF
jgi:hypothetical protein